MEEVEWVMLYNYYWQKMSMQWLGDYLSWNWLKELSSKVDEKLMINDLEVEKTVKKTVVRLRLEVEESNMAVVVEDVN